MSRVGQLGVILPVVFLTLTRSVAAQEVEASLEAQVISALPHMIQWSGVLVSLFVIAAAWLLLRSASRIVNNIGEVFAERRLFLQKLNTFFRFAIYLVTAVAVVLLSFRISAQILVLLGGTLAVAIGFALKDLVASVVAGVMMLFDRPFQVGDRVTFGGEYGDVTSIGVRSVKLRTLDDNTVTIPNSGFLTNVTSCGNYGVLHMLVVVDFHVDQSQDVQRAMDLIREATATSRYIYLPKPIVVHVSQVMIQNHIALRLRLKAYVLDTQYEKDFETDVTLRVVEAFGQSGIQAPAMLHRSAWKPAAPAGA
jgi:small-conductance mechanosensitive channel